MRAWWYNKSMRFSLAMVLLAMVPLPALAMDTIAKQAYMADFDTGTVLLAKEADTPVPPSSMSKLMTAYITFGRLKEGKAEFDQTFKVSEKAWAMQGSKMFVHVGDDVRLEDLIRGMIIQSGNDACIVIAEGLSGSEEAFATEMNATAKKQGLTGSHFVNATGWPDEAQLMTAHDLATLAQHIITDYPEYYHFYSEREFTYNNITQPNRNRLLGSDIGVDGLKTGHTEIAGYGITLSAKDKDTGRRVILVINGLNSDDDRVKEGDRLLRYGLKAFENKTILKAGEEVARIPVWMGADEEVALVAEKDVMVTLAKSASANAEVKVKYENIAQAPVSKGSQLANLVIFVPDQESVIIPLVAGQDVKKMSWVRKALFVLKYKLLGH